MTIRFCTLAIHAAYRRRARLLCADAAGVPWVVLTDAPETFADMPNVRAVGHAPTGPMATDYLERLPPTGESRGAAAYHDKRFAILGALDGYDTAIYVDADSRVGALPPLGAFAPGLAVLPVVRRTVAEHLDQCGTWRRPAFEALARELAGDAGALGDAPWCHEALVAVTADERAPRFFDAWSFAAEFLQARGVYSGEGGVIGLAAAVAGWEVDFAALDALGAAVRHEGGGPKAW